MVLFCLIRGERMMKCNMVATLATKKLGFSAEETPRVLRKIWGEFNFINTGESAVINVEE